MKKIEIYAILNLTPDSFFEGSRVGEGQLHSRIEEALVQGADVLDIGGFSTRPGHQEVSESEELRRLRWGLKVLKEYPAARISIDTFRPAVVQQLYDEFGPFVVNDIGGGEPQMLRTVGQLGLDYVLMSSGATVAEVDAFFERKVLEISELGVGNVMLDPGFGFGKTRAQNFEVLGGMERFLRFGLPIFVGISRKSMIFRTLGTSPAESLNGTTALHMMALERGATILRVHDVGPARECITLFEETQKQ